MTIIAYWVFPEYAYGFKKHTFFGQVVMAVAANAFSPSSQEVEARRSGVWVKLNHMNWIPAQLTRQPVSEP